MKRRNFIQTTGLSLASVIVSDRLFDTTAPPIKQLINLPDDVSAIINGQAVKLIGKGKQGYNVYH